MEDRPEWKFVRIPKFGWEAFAHPGDRWQVDRGGSDELKRCFWDTIRSLNGQIMGNIVEKRNKGEPWGLQPINMVGDSVIVMRELLRRKAHLGARLVASREWVLFWTHLEIPRRPLYKWFWLYKRWLVGDTTVEGIQAQLRASRRSGWGPPRVYTAKAMWAVTRPLRNTSSKHEPLHKTPPGFPYSETAVRMPMVLQLSAHRVLCAAPGTALLWGIILSVCHLSKLFFCVRIIFRHKNSGSEAWV